MGRTNKHFTQSLYDKFDFLAFEATKNNCSPFERYKNHEEDYKIDYKLVGKGKLLGLLELEVCTGWKGSQFPYKNIHFLYHKVKKYKNQNYSFEYFGVEGVPTFYCIFNSDCSYVAITAFADISGNPFNVWTKYGEQKFYSGNFERTEVIKTEHLGKYFLHRLCYPETYKAIKEKVIIPQNN